LDKDLDAVKRKGDEIRNLVRRGIFIKDGHSIRITTSIGVAWTVPGYKGKAEDPIKAADMMLYTSKHDGRNRVSYMILNDPADLDDMVSSATLIELEDEEDTDFGRIYHL
jgi:predicted signal transduction protein with EAL and GGDEF domain